MHYELTDDECTAIEPTLPNKPRGRFRSPKVRVFAGRW
jgi:hypothetical protein